MAKTEVSQFTPQVNAYTVREAARELGVTATAVYQWLRDGVLEEMHLAAGHLRLVSTRSVLALKAKRLANPPKVGRPKAEVAGD